MLPVSSSSYIGQSEADAVLRHKKRDLQSEILILESDRKKREHRRDELSLEVRKMQVELRRLEGTISEKQQEQEKSDREAALLTAEIKRLKRHLDALH